MSAKSTAYSLLTCTVHCWMSGTNHWTGRQRHPGCSWQGVRQEQQQGWGQEPEEKKGLTVVGGWACLGQGQGLKVWLWAVRHPAATHSVQARRRNCPVGGSHKPQNRRQGCQKERLPGRMGSIRECSIPQRIPAFNVKHRTQQTEQQRKLSAAGGAVWA